MANPFHHGLLVLVPEPFQKLCGDEAFEALYRLLDDFAERISNRRNGTHGLAVVAEGVGEFFRQRFGTLDRIDLREPSFSLAITAYLADKVRDGSGRAIPIFTNEPRHYVRSIPANPHDRVYCERLGALAVDSALAGYTDFMVSQWLTEYVLVPLELVTQDRQRKAIPPDGMFWKQVESSTGQIII